MRDTHPRPVRPYFVEVTITQSFNLIIDAEVSDQAEAIAQHLVYESDRLTPLTPREGELWDAFLDKHGHMDWQDIATKDGVRVHVHSAGVIGS